MEQTAIFDAELIRRYDKSGPRYTSYPTAVQFHEGFGEAEYRAQAARTNAERPQRPLSLYFHIPFCDTLCFYCACSKIPTRNRAHAAPYLERLQREIALQGALFDRARVVEQLHWGGGTPTFVSHAQMEDLMRTTRAHFTLREDDGGEYSIEIDPRELRPDTLAWLRGLGFNRLSMGVQDFDPRVQRAVNRIQTEEATAAACAQARAAGYQSISLDLIYGLPFQTVAGFGRTLERVLALAPDRLSMFNYAHLPELFPPQRRINESDLPSPAEKLAILQQAIERLTSAGYVYIGMDHFARPDDELAVAQRAGSLYRNFQGYSTHADCDLVAMGVTSIGKVGDSYSQNVKQIEEYSRRVDAGRLPIYRGIELDLDDRIRREVITGLICHFELDGPALGRRYGIEFESYFRTELAELGPLQHDGLLTVEDGLIRVSAAGRLLIRNICMVFDRHLRAGAAQRYSKVI